jgi:hypothetical protein
MPYFGIEPDGAKDGVVGVYQLAFNRLHQNVWRMPAVKPVAVSLLAAGIKAPEYEW